MMDFGTFIKNRRLELGLTLEQVGDKCGVGKSTVRKWEQGMIQNIRRDKISLLAAALQIDPVDLIDYENARPSEDDDLYDLREQMRRDPEMRNLFDLARRATPSDLRAAAAVLKALEKNGHD